MTKGEGLQDSARGLTPGTDKRAPALKVAVEKRFPPWMANEILNEFLPPLQPGPYCQCVLGLKPQAQSYSPFLLRHPELRRTGRDKEFYTI